MRSKNLAPLGGAVIALLMTSAAWAAEPNGWYAGWDIGANFDGSNAAVSSLTKPSGITAKWKYKTNTNWAGFGKLGYRFDPNWRAELELGYRAGGIKSIGGTALSGMPSSVCTLGACGTPPGSLTQWTGMFNVLYDIMPDAQFHPFVGAGAGIDHLVAI